MGWRAQDAYEKDQIAEWRKLPLRHRYNWGTITVIAITVIAALWYRFS